MRHGWSLERNAWSGLPHDVVHRKLWRCVQFDVGEAVSVPAASGVYVICASPPGRRRRAVDSANDLFGLLYTAIYAGKTDSLRRRFEDHCRNPKVEIDASRRCFSDSLDFWFIRVDRESLDIVETRLIDCLGPPANAIRGVISARIHDPVRA